MNAADPTPTAPTLRVLVLPAAPPGPAAVGWGCFDFQPCATLADVGARLRERPADAVLLALPDAGDALRWPALSHAVLDAAVVVVGDAAPALVVQLLQQGVQDVLPPSATPDSLARALRQAVERKHLELAARKAYATDLSTGLPHHTQLQEHMAHLLALREREPAPMALIVLRIGGLARTAEQLGAEAANVLRRKAAVRLRAGLRASDVVASIGNDAFAVLLAWMDAPTAGERVAAKLAMSLAEPFSVAGRLQTLQVSAGLASYPEHGKDADTLLRRALGQAAQVALMGREGRASRVDHGAAAAANDDEV